MFYMRNDPNSGVRMKDRRPEKRDLDGATGNPLRDGYTRLSRADRETGQRETSGDPVYPRFVPDER